MQAAEPQACDPKSLPLSTPSRVPRMRLPPPNFFVRRFLAIYIVARSTLPCLSESQGWQAQQDQAHQVSLSYAGIHSNVYHCVNSHRPH